MSQPVLTDYGFQWGPLEVARVSHFQPRADREYYTIQVHTEFGAVDIYVSRTGRSIRVFRDHEELR